MSLLGYSAYMEAKQKILGVNIKNRIEYWYCHLPELIHSKQDVGVFVLWDYPLHSTVSPGSDLYGFHNILYVTVLQLTPIRLGPPDSQISLDPCPFCLSSLLPLLLPSLSFCHHSYSLYLFPYLLPYLLCFSQYLPLFNSHQGGGNGPPLSPTLGTQSVPFMWAEYTLIL